MKTSEWEASVPEAIKQDVLWKTTAYRRGLFAADIGWQDVEKLFKDGRTRSLADQLYRSLGSISANITEGYSRNSGRDRARFFEYALGSAREARDWYYKARHVLGDAVIKHRINLLTEIVKLLTVTVQSERNRSLKEEPIEYETAIDPQ
ncbi:MAG: four helix bundle protein [Caldilineaceae bacterium]|nr:four helix bundle protein [Caldilineaceae bacterium]MBP8109951.1 four helix bundle protein [Caldilineaceae bacterium]MBP8124969.1 four helix bundle protein [Caldilineaceae bacterium]MBP9074758.1 four helix bundle protein [Caldilineaceae bacterium]